MEILRKRVLTKVINACVLLISISGGKMPGENGRLDRKEDMYGEILLPQAAAAFATAAANLFCCVSLRDGSTGEMDADVNGGGGGREEVVVIVTSLLVGVLADGVYDVFCAPVDVFFWLVALFVVASNRGFRFKLLDIKIQIINIILISLKKVLIC